MILISLKLNYFKQYQELELDFREGLAGIAGRNGAGKSSIFEAVLLCLFGEIKMDKDYIRSSWATTKQAVVLELRFEVDGKAFRVAREYRGKAMTHQAQLYDHKDQSLAAGAKPVTEAITELIGMDKDSFMRSIFSGQKELGEISNTRGEERRKMIRKMVGLDKLDKIQNVIREDRNKIKNQIKGQENLLYDPKEVKDFEQQLKTQNKELEGQEKKEAKIKKELEAKQQLYLKTQKAYQLHSEKYKLHNELIHAFNKYESSVEGFEIRSKDLLSQIETLNKTKEALQKIAPQIEAFEKQQKELLKLEESKATFEKINSINERKGLLLEQSKEIKEVLNELEKEVKSLPQVEEKLTKLTKANQTEQANISQQEKQIAELNLELGAIQGKINDRKSSIQNIRQLGKEAECPTCFQPLLMTYDQTLSKLQQEIKGYEQQKLKELNTSIQKLYKDLETLKTKHDKNKTTENDLKAQINLLNEKQKNFSEQQNKAKQKQADIAQLNTQIKTVGKVSFVPKTYQSLKNAITDFNDTYIKYRSQQDDIAKIPELKEKRATLLERIKNGKTAIKDQQSKITKLAFNQEKHDAAYTQQQKLEQEKDTIQQSFSDQKEVIFNLKTAIQQIAQDLKNNDKILQSIKDQRDELQQLENLDVVFTKFKTNILERVKPVISHHASHLFNQITKGRYESIRVDNNFEFHIFDNGDYYPITRFSGGEIDLANLCLRIGISKAISDLSGSSAASSLLCFDEIFGSQDEERRFEILNALDLLKEQYRQIYIISHIESIKDHFPNILQVRKTENGSLAAWAG